jgi:hypothetical protein
MTSEEMVSYPVGLEIRRQESQSRLTNFPLGIGTLIRFILAIPHIIVVSLLGIVAAILYFIATFAILFTGRYPQEFFNFILRYQRWNIAVNGYILHLYDTYPPFSLDPPAESPLAVSVQYPAQSSRILNLPLLGSYIRGILLIPHFIVVFFLAIAMYVVVFIAQFAILFTGSFPAGMHSFCVGVTRWGLRLTAYTFGLTDKYPPFSTGS